jgi:hypothetical protein
MCVHARDSSTQTILRAMSGHYSLPSHEGQRTNNVTVVIEMRRMPLQIYNGSIILTSHIPVSTAACYTQTTLPIDPRLHAVMSTV